METKSTIKLNGYSFPLASYSKHTIVNDGNVSSYASISFGKGVTTDNLESLLLAEITDVQIWTESDMVYELSNKQGRITNVNESYNDGNVNVYANISF